MNVSKSTEISTRDDFARLCNDRGLLDRALEVGVDRAAFAVLFLDTWKGELMILVDPWTPYPGRPHDRTPDYDLAIAALARHNTRVSVYRESWAAAFRQIWGTLDFVYIDGDHRHASVELDIALAWSKIRPGGILAGHDFAERIPGVVEAVHDFSDREGIEILVTGEILPSWYCYKPDRSPPAEEETSPAQEKTGSEADSPDDHQEAHK